jgi:hypothetical protein
MTCISTLVMLLSACQTLGLVWACVCIKFDPNMVINDEFHNFI